MANDLSDRHKYIPQTRGSKAKKALNDLYHCDLMVTRVCDGSPFRTE